MNKALFRWGDAFPVCACLLLIAVMVLASAWRGEGAVVRVQTPDGAFVLSLETDAQRELCGRDGLKLTVTVKDGRACVLCADCPDQVCVATGWLSKHGQTAACVPAGIVLTIEASDDEAAPDAVAR